MFNKSLLMGGYGKPLITFYFSSNSNVYKYKAEKGMTWYEFVNSGYNIHRFNSSGNSYYKMVCAYGETGPVNYAWYWLDGSLGSYAAEVTLEVDKYPYESTSVSGTDKIIDGYTYGHWVCYAVGTLITLYDGTTKKIEDITYDDDLLVWDFDNGCFASAKPSWISKAQLCPYYYKITLDDGTQLDLIGSNGDCHRLFNVDQSKFVYGSRFNLGERTFKQDKSTPKVVSIERVDKDVVYYNMITKYHINCFINGVLSSCRYNNLYPIKDMKFVKTSRATVPLSAYSNVPVEYYYDLRLGEVDVTAFPIEETNDYVQRLVMLKA